jgi:hypothetical protein
MTNYNSAVAKLAMPARIAKLPVDARGYPVPKFVEWIDGAPDFRCIDFRYWLRCVRKQLCWVCGEPLGRHMAFVIGPMCAINRVSSEPPSHLECARFAAKACPFLTQPRRRRNEANLPAAGQLAAGITLARNPGVTLVWVSKGYGTFSTPDGGRLIRLGEPTLLEWYAHGRAATRPEIMASIESGLPLLQEAAEKDGADAVAELAKQVAVGLALVPA